MKNSELIENLIGSTNDLINNSINDLSILEGDENHFYLKTKISRRLNLANHRLNSLSYSLSGFKADFKEDCLIGVKYSEESFHDILLKSMADAINYMFEGVNFSIFTRRYFETKDSYDEARKEWERITFLDYDISDIQAFTNEYMFNFVFHVKAKDLKISNYKLSQDKFKYLFTEIFLNAIKYSCFIPKKMRMISIDMEIDSQIEISISNYCHPNIFKQSNTIGTEIIDNYSRILCGRKAKVIEKKRDPEYIVKLKFDNFWK